MPVISVIVPVYKVEQYLQRCIDSLVRQTLREIEVILVDDGSPDSCGRICDEYARQDSRVRVIHKENGGVSSARNAGLEFALGKWIAFVDADDYIAEDMLEKLYAEVKKHNADMVMSDFCYVDSNGAKLSGKSRLKSQLAVLNRDEAFFRITDLRYNAGINVCSKLFKADVIQNHRFIEGIPLGEDQEFVFSCLAECDTIVLVDQPLYYYVIHEESTMHQHIDIDKEKCLVKTYNRILQIKEWNETQGMKKRLITFRMCQCELTIMNKMISCRVRDKRFQKELYKYIRRNLKYAIFSDIPVWKQIQIAVAATNIEWYKMFMGIKKFFGGNSR